MAKKKQPAAGHVVLDVAALRKTPALTRAWADLLAESAAVCLDQNRHRPEVPLKVNTDSSTYTLKTRRVNQKMMDAHGDTKRATDLGACGVAILVIREKLGFETLKAVRQGDGFDYWIGAADPNEFLFQKRARLEVSGILKGTSNDVANRLRQKLKQTRRSDSCGFPAVAAVVEFGCPQALVEERQ